MKCIQLLEFVFVQIMSDIEFEVNNDLLSYLLLLNIIFKHNYVVLDGRLAQQYEAKLQQSLQELREQQEANIKANRDEIEALYENKVVNPQTCTS